MAPKALNIGEKMRKAIISVSTGAITIGDSLTRITGRSITVLFTLGVVAQRFLAWKLKKKNAAADTAEDSRPSDAKIDYERKKREASERRKSAARLDRAKEAVTRIEARLAEIEAECEAKASDHVALAALWEERDRLEAELMENYEIIMGE